MVQVRDEIEMAGGGKLVVLVAREGVAFSVETGNGSTRLPSKEEWIRYRDHVLQKMDFHLFRRADDLAEMGRMGVSAPSRPVVTHLIEEPA